MIKNNYRKINFENQKRSWMSQTARLRKGLISLYHHPRSLFVFKVSV